MSYYPTPSSLYSARPAQELDQWKLTGQMDGTTKGTILIAGLLCLWEGLPFSLVGLPNIFGLQLFSLLVFIGTGIYFFRCLARNLQFGRWERVAVLLFTLCVGVSFIYSNYIRPQPLAAWIFAVYSIAPVLTLLALRAANCTIGDAMAALFWSGFIGAVVLTINQTFELGLLDFYGRGSAFGTERVVFFKLESTFALVISTVRALYAKSLRQLLLYASALAFTFYSTIFLTESRLAILAVSLTLALTWLLVLRGKRKAMLFLLSPMIVLPALWFVVNKYLADFKGLGVYLSQDVSASWRQVTSDHFKSYFLETYGLGFGFMSANPEYNNVISYSSNFASAKYGVVGYVVSLDDIGIFSALYQYGYLGLALIICMSLMMALSLYKAQVLGPAYRVVAAVGILVATFMLSPISMNYFTLFYTAHIGGVLWFMAAEAHRLRRAVKSTIDLR